MFYSFLWERTSNNHNGCQIRTTFLTEEGRSYQIERHWEDWIGVCTSRIDRVLASFHTHFPGHCVRYETLGTTRKILPYFEQRLASGKLEYRSKPFYKLYTTACHKDVGRLFHAYKIGYYDPSDWLSRLYVDLCTRNGTHSFYYAWYDVIPASTLVLDAYVMHPERTDYPDWTIGAFDIETVPMDGGNRVPTGLDATDAIVMMSLCKWNRRRGMRKYLFYLLPDASAQPLVYDHGYAYRSESQMLNDFHVTLSECHILTGYNVNRFDFPCIFSRLVWLNKYDILAHYSSYRVGEDVITTFQNKLVLDLYTYFRTFSKHDLPSFKLDDVAFVKLKQSKVPVKSTGIWSWYTNPSTAASLLTNNTVEVCYDLLRPTQVASNQFGTFRTYLDYCLQDSRLVYELFLKEQVLSFLIQRANFTALNVVGALHFGTSRFLLELFKTYGTRLGFFFNAAFFKGATDSETYQGGLNFCLKPDTYRNVSILDFTSMYPSAIFSSNLCFGTCTIMSREEWLRKCGHSSFIAIPYRTHSAADFASDGFGDSDRFGYPACTERDEQVMVTNPHATAFLPCIVRNFLRLRRDHQERYRSTRDLYHKNVQQCIKILLNSLYGVLATKDSVLCCQHISMITVTLARYQLLGSYHFLTRLKYTVCYVDTDSLMIPDWPTDHCDVVNRYLDLPHVELKYEEKVKGLLILSKKKYVKESEDGTLVAKGFQKKINDVEAYMTNTILKASWKMLFPPDLDDNLDDERNDSSDDDKNFSDDENNLSENDLSGDENNLDDLSNDLDDDAKKGNKKKFKKKRNVRVTQGWVLWVETLLHVQYMCRDPKRYSIYRKTKHRHEYKSNKCAAARMLDRYPDKANDYIEYTYCQADVAVSEVSKWVMDPQDCECVNFEKLFVNQKKIFCTLLNLAYWNQKSPTTWCNYVLNSMRWKRFVHAELLYKRETKRNLTIWVERGVEYTFKVNNHLKSRVKKS